MNLPFPFIKRKKEEESEYFLALLLTDEKVSAIILHESLGVIKIIGKQEEFFTSSLEDAGLENLINTVDKAVSRAEEVLPPNVQTHKTVFGVKDTWVEPETKKITKENLIKLKKVCDSLDLTPIGFMVTIEAISHLLQEEDGAPLSAILAEIGRKTVALTLLRGGKTVEQIDGPLTDSAPVTVDNLLKHFTTAVLPARIILYDAKTTESLSQEFISHQWSKSLPFLHVPQVTALPAGFDAKAVSFGAATQMGFEFSGVETKTEKTKEIEAEEEPTRNASHSDADGATDGDSDYIPSKRLKHPLNEEEETPLRPSDSQLRQGFDGRAEGQAEETTSIISADNFGFVTDEDISKSISQPKEEIMHHTRSDEKPEKKETTDFVMNNHQNERDEEEQDEEPEKSSKAFPFALPIKLPLPKIALPKLSGKRKLLIPIGILIVLAALIGGMTSYYYNSVKAHIILAVEPKIVEEETDVIFSGTSASDFSKNIIAAKPIETTVEGSLTIDTTGKKDVGNKAKGTVTIYNSGGSSATLANGTAIKSSNGLTFLLDKEVNVASASGDIFSGTKPGTVDVQITAKDIGTESNLPSGTKFSVGTSSSLAAKNDSAFSGGSKKQVQVVSKNDVAKLRNDLPKSLEAKAKEAIAQKADSTMTLLPLISIVSLDKATFDNDVDDEATKVKLTANVLFGALAYENNELNNFAKSLLKEKYSQDISDNSMQNIINDPEETEDETVEAKLLMKAGLLPDINTEDIIRKVADKSPDDAKTLLNNLPQIAASQINFSPGIPLLPNLFPRLPNQISIEIKAE